ncbi:hypothetical protein ACLD9W_12625, partial [Neisseria sp. WLZKY-1]|uniref:hypothetical protein n=1 Tax=Neisseria sp. WLZKY-1 TaxID=3390377 RepID=UPI0039787E7D
VIILPKTVPPKTVSKRLDLSFGIFARRGEKYSCYGLWGSGRLKHPHPTLPRAGRRIGLENVWGCPR